MRWAGYVARMVEGRVLTVFWWGNLEDPDVDGRYILRRIYRKRVGERGLDLSGLG